MKPLQGKNQSRPGIGPLANAGMSGDQSLSAGDTSDTGATPSAPGISGVPHTRPPASVRAKEQLEREAALMRGMPAKEAWTGTLPHSAPSISARDSEARDDEWLTTQVLKLRTALAAGATEQIERAVQELFDAGLRFDREPLASHPAATEFIGMAPIRVLQIFRNHAFATRLAMRLIEMGCNANACDDLDNTVLMYASKHGLTELVEFLLADCPELALHRLNFYGRNAAMIAQANGNTQVLGMLTDAGILLNPPNAAVIYFESNRERFTGAHAQEAYDQLWRLLQHTHYMNLADATGKTLIFHAVLNQDVDAVRFLCRRSDYPNLSLRDHDNKSVFDYAALIGDDVKRREIINALKALRSEINPLGEHRKKDH